MPPLRFCPPGVLRSRSRYRLGCCAVVALAYYPRAAQRLGLDRRNAYWSGVSALFGGLWGGHLLGLYVHGGFGGPLDLFRIWEGGMSYYGGLVGGGLGGVVYLRHCRLSVLAYADASVPAVCLGYGIGRLGCFLNGDDYGGLAQAPWAVVYPPGSEAYLDHVAHGWITAGAPWSLPVHPAQLYASLLGFGMFAALANWRPRYRGNRLCLFVSMVWRGAIPHGIPARRFPPRPRAILPAPTFQFGVCSAGHLAVGPSTESAEGNGRYAAAMHRRHACAARTGRGMTRLRQSDALIGRVRIRTSLADPQAAQQRVARLLNAAGIHQSRLPPSAILCVRTLRDPSRTAWLDSTLTQLPLDWECAVTRQLDALAAGAVYPARSAAPPSANAVAFLDRAEWLACLARDWLKGTLRTNWWWFTLLQSGDPGMTVAREWEDSPEFLPAAIDALQRHSLAIEFVRTLPDPEVDRLLTKMLHVHGLANAPVPASFAACSAQAEVPEQAVVSLPAESPPVARDPWLPWVPEASAPSLSFSARLLLAYALLLRRAPGVARSKEFASRIDQSRSLPAAAQNTLHRAQISAQNPELEIPPDDRISVPPHRASPALRAVQSAPSAGYEPDIATDVRYEPVNDVSQGLGLIAAPEAQPPEVRAQGASPAEELRELAGEPVRIPPLDRDKFLAMPAERDAPSIAPSSVVDSEEQRKQSIRRAR